MSTGMIDRKFEIWKIDKNQIRGNLSYKRSTQYFSASEEFDDNYCLHSYKHF